MTALGDFSARTIDGRERALSEYAGQVVLVVNTASKCGFTPQYRGLQQLQDDFEGRGFTVLGFPCDQFAHQEPGSHEEIASFCESRYAVTFPLFEKVEVNGAGAHPLYQWLRGERSGMLGSRIKWNFTKFLVGRDGQVVSRHPPTTDPSRIAGEIEGALAAG